MLSSVFRRLFRRPSASPARAVLGLDLFEDRLVPSSVTFTNGVLYVQADPNANDYVQITAAGKHHDGSTGVRLVTNATGTWADQVYGSATAPVTNIALDMGNGNDFVDVASLTATTVFVGEGNGNDVVLLGATKSGGLIAGSGTDYVSIGGGSTNLFNDSSLPGVLAGTAVYLGWGYQFGNGGTSISTNGGVGNNNANVVNMCTTATETSLVDVNGSGNNWIFGGRGSDNVYVLGNGNNSIFTGSGDNHVVIYGNGNNRVGVGSGDDTVNISGSGNNTVWSRGSGSITVAGGGENVVYARDSSDLTVALNGAGADSSVSASLTDSVYVDGTLETASGVDGNVTVKLV
jgi:hypothetical protein